MRVFAVLVCRRRGHLTTPMWFARDGYHVRRVGCARCRSQVRL